MPDGQRDEIVLEPALRRLAVELEDQLSVEPVMAGLAREFGPVLEQVRTWPDRVRQVTADAVRDAARRWLNKHRSVTGYLVKETRPEEKRS